MGLFNKTRPVTTTEPHCSFCSRTESVVGPMVEGPNAAFICADCVSIAAGVVDANRGRSAPPNLDANQWRAAHMNFVCYVHVWQDTGGTWKATASTAPGVEADGATPEEAVRLIQSKVLALASKALEDGKEVVAHFTNHLDAALR